ncbi:hypothetical protein Z946_333 [Sulfitobacter noctilucicola]|uniref:AcrR family transcriptional regulator n=1 Tax=Sulfitobacter noctilucicola TaxID=1342301 RepID=A0A7W6Q793_9RHOB|nr:TetR family transcriptional regulator [Sulfitobacter noctilucicola]KIN66321.1 hypothetical protein Z946_333 [Sulfitobacter noctilucicola]MBB4175672.1 AcrR family transcriptional regulator [Sulfitobacter noctilucicola]
MTDRPFQILAAASERKARILAESLGLFDRKGLSATSMRDKAEATGMSRLSLHTRLKTKIGLAPVCSSGFTVHISKV